MRWFHLSDWARQWIASISHIILMCCLRYMMGMGLGRWGRVGNYLPDPRSQVHTLAHCATAPHRALAFRGKLGPFYISRVVHCYPNRFIHQHINTKCNVSSIGLLQIHSKQIKDVAIYCLQLLNPSCEMLDGLC